MYSVINYTFIFHLIIYTKSAPISKTEAMVFLNKFGYTNNTSSDGMENAIINFQNNLNLPETGMLDATTLAQMDQPRCGRPDGLEIKNNLYVWRKNSLTYKIINGPMSGRLNVKNVEDELREAFKMWAKHIPVNFEKNNYIGDIEIRFVNPEQTEKSDGRGKTLAYAYYPDVGDIYFDAEDWSLDSSKGFNFRIVAAHEIGHSLGLSHSKNKNSLMYPSYKPYRAGWTLHDSDISSIQNLYGKDYVCQFGQIDGIFNRNTNTIVVVKGKYCWMFEKYKLMSGFPKLCGKMWKNFPPKIDAIFKKDEKIFFFTENNLYLHQNNGKQKINFNLGDIKNIDTILLIKDRLYIFEGTNYWTFIKKNNTWTKKSGSNLITSFWKGIPSDLDAAIFDNEKYVYFFKNNEVYKFNIDTKNTIISPFLINGYFQC